MWKGPISCAVFVQLAGVSLLNDVIERMRVCFPFIYDYVEFHLVYEADVALDLSFIGTWSHISCDEVIKLLNSVSDDIDLPLGLLWNVARIRLSLFSSHSEANEIYAFFMVRPRMLFIYDSNTGGPPVEVLYIVYRPDLID